MKIEEFNIQNFEHHNNILIVDDDPRLRELLNRFLTENGFNVTEVASGPELTSKWKDDCFDLIILDIMMTPEDGCSICNRLRKSGVNIPIIMLTAKNSEDDLIETLASGADDYVSKPFKPRTLLARIHNQLRRYTARTIPGAPSIGGKIYKFGPFQFNLATRQLFKNGQNVNITTSEYAILKIFVQHPNEPLSREFIMTKARGKEYKNFDRSIDVQISRIRKIIDINDDGPSFIQTIWGKGYVFVPNGNEYEEE